MGQVESPNAPATIGQLKNMAFHLHAVLEKELAGGAGFQLSELFPDPPARPDAAWFEEQRTIATVGQLKFISSAFYQRLYQLNPDWVTAQLRQNGITPTPGQRYPWVTAPGGEDDKAVVSLSQLKFAFSLRVLADSDGDGISDLIDGSLKNGTSEDDSDGDGLSDQFELTLGSDPYDSDSDDDYASDGFEYYSSRK